MRYRLALAGMIALPAPAAAAQDGDAMLARARSLTAAPACPTEPSDAIVVCGRTDDSRRYRLPLPAERAALPVLGGGNLAAADILRPPGDCGPSGTRRCTRREALSEGFGGGRDPITLLGRLAGRLLDPDADIAPLPRPE